MNNKQKTQQSNISLLDNGNLITSEKEVANTFNKYFINVADNLTKKTWKYECWYLWLLEIS